jgi:hypothetical protein
MTDMQMFVEIYLQVDLSIQTETIKLQHNKEILYKYQYDKAQIRIQNCKIPTNRPVLLLLRLY